MKSLDLKLGSQNNCQSFTSSWSCHLNTVFSEFFITRVKGERGRKPRWGWHATRAGVSLNVSIRLVMPWLCNEFIINVILLVYEERLLNLINSRIQISTLVYFPTCFLFLPASRMCSILVTVKGRHFLECISGLIIIAQTGNGNCCFQCIIIMNNNYYLLK